MEKEILRASKSKTVRNTKRKKTHSIMMTLLLSFVLPVALMIILGIVSYQTASTSIISKYRESAMGTVAAVSEYCDMVCDSISTKSVELITNSDLGDYYNKDYKSKDKNVSAKSFRNALNVISNITSANDNIFSCSVISEEATHITSLKGVISEIPYSQFVETDEGRIFAEDKKARNQWLGYHSFLDNNTESTTEQYALAYYQKALKTNSYLVIDVNMAVAEDMLDQMDFGEGSIKAIVTPDGREVVSLQGSDETVQEIESKLEQPYFVGYDFGDSESEEAAYSTNINISGESYLYISAPVGETGIMICALVPRSNLLGQVEQIKYVTVVMVILAACVALVIGLFISAGISKTVKNMTSGIAAVAEGDLTTSFTTKRRDEFSILTDSLNSMLANMRVLMQDMKQFGTKVNNLTGDVSAKTAGINRYMQNVATSMDEVSAGVFNQAQDIELSNGKMMDFSATINSVTNKTNNMGITADRTIDVVEQGKLIVQELSDKSNVTVQLTKELVEDINAVQESTEEIKGFADVINSIARQTNLLSLNASIEAVRAGERGKGFSVIADEIRTLANQSSDSARKINELLIKINETTYKTTESAQRAEIMVNQQASSLNDTVAVFGTVHESVGNLVEDMHMIATALSQIIVEKDQIQNSFQNISAVSEEVAASTEEVSTTLTDQVADVRKLNEEIEMLRTDVAELDKSIAKFKI